MGEEQEVTSSGSTISNIPEATSFAGVTSLAIHLQQSMDELFVETSAMTQKVIDVITPTKVFTPSKAPFDNISSDRAANRHREDECDTARIEIVHSPRNAPPLVQFHEEHKESEHEIMIDVLDDEESVERQMFADQETISKEVEADDKEGTNESEEMKDFMDEDLGQEEVNDEKEMSGNQKREELSDDNQEEMTSKEEEADVSEEKKELEETKDVWEKCLPKIQQPEREQTNAKLSLETSKEKMVKKIEDLENKLFEMDREYEGQTAEFQGPEEVNGEKEVSEKQEGEESSDLETEKNVEDKEIKDPSAEMATDRGGGDIVGDEIAGEGTGKGSTAVILAASDDKEEYVAFGIGSATNETDDEAMKEKASKLTVRGKGNIHEQDERARHFIAAVSMSVSTHDKTDVISIRENPYMDDNNGEKDDCQCREGCIIS